MRRTLLCLTSLLFLSPLGAQEVTTYLPMVEDLAPEALELLADLNEGSVERRMASLDELCRVAAQGELGNALVFDEATGSLRGLHALIRERVSLLEAEDRETFRAYQQQLTDGLQELGSGALLLRSPAADAAADHWRARLEAALEAGDVNAAVGFYEAAREWGHALEGEGAAFCSAWSHAAVRGELAQVASRVAPGWAGLANAMTRPTPLVTVPRRDPRLLANVRLPGREWTHSSPTHPLLRPRRVIVSTGSAVLRYSRTGTLLSRFPQRQDGAAPAPSEGTRFRAVLSSVGDTVFAPLALERWLAPAREPARESTADPALGGYYYSLVGLGQDDLRVSWWDGDPGSGPQPIALAANASVEASLRKGHVIGCASDGARIYVAYLTKGTELSLSLFAYRTVSRHGAGLSLEPAWPRPVQIVQVEHSGGADQAVRPEVAVSLSLDGNGRLVCVTDVGIAACAAVATGRLEWIVERFKEREEGRFGNNTVRKTEQVVTPPPVDALIVPDPEHPELGPVVVALVGPKLLGVRLWTGEEVWSAPRVTLEYLLPGAGNEFVAYGATQAQGLNALTGKSIYARSRALNLGRFRFCGLGVRVSNGYLIPVRRDNVGAVSLHRLAWRDLPRGQRALLFDGSHWLPVSEPVNLAIDADHVVAAGSTRLQVLTFAE